jgi:uncharacterized protein
VTPADQPSFRTFRPFAEREVAIGGWVAEQMRTDLSTGFVGHLDRLAPDLILDDDIFGADRLTAGVTAKDLGALSDDTEWSAQFLWWNAETQGNWRDGWLRHCMAVGDAAERDAARAWVERVLASQDPDGYLGIYAPDLRFPQRGENGELWAQAVLLRALLGHHGHTGDERVLQAVRRAVERTMAGYPIEASQPFGLERTFGGVTHGLMFTDVLWELAGLTGDRRYLAYAAWLYRSFATSPVVDGDARADELLDDGRGFEGHGVHTYEHWRALTVAAVAAIAGEGTADGLPMEALEAAYARKLGAALTPSGAPNGDEACHPRGTADDTGYEHCSVLELLQGYAMRVEATGDVSIGDRMESLVFNVALGARDPLEGGVAYLKTDNSRSMTGVEGFRPITNGAPQTRYMYSPLHREAAVCCVPSAGRVLPTYARYAWMRGEEDGRPQVIALLYGASELRTEIHGVPVTITQETAWPAELAVRLTVEAAAPVDFDLVLRVPGYASAWQVLGVHGKRLRTAPSVIRIGGTWSGRTTVQAGFDAAPEVRETPAGVRLVAHGPLLYALPLPGRREVVRTFDLPDVGRPFRDVRVHPAQTAPDLRLPANAKPRPAPVPSGTEAAGALHAWQRRGLAVDMTDRDDRRREAILVPMGATILRVVAFPSARAPSPLP